MEIARFESNQTATERDAEQSRVELSRARQEALALTAKLRVRESLVSETEVALGATNQLLQAQVAELTRRIRDQPRLTPRRDSPRDANGERHFLPNPNAAALGRESTPGSSGGRESTPPPQARLSFEIPMKSSPATPLQEKSARKPGPVPRLSLAQQGGAEAPTDKAPVSSRFTPREPPNTARSTNQQQQDEAEALAGREGETPPRGEEGEATKDPPPRGADGVQDVGALASAKAMAVQRRPRGMSAKEYLNTFHGPNRLGARTARNWS